MYILDVYFKNVKNFKEDILN